MTRLEILAQALREMAAAAEEGRVAGASVVWLDEQANSRAVVYSPRVKDEAGALFAGLVANAAIMAMAAGLPPEKAELIMRESLATALREREEVDHA